MTAASPVLTQLSPVKTLYSQLCTEDIKPRAKKKDVPWEPGVCCVCGDQGDTLPADALFTMTFGSWQEMQRYETTSRLCKPCTWAFKDKRFLRHPFWIERDVVEQLEWHELVDRLTARPLPASVSVIAPQGGRKIVAPYAEYGVVVADGGPIRWTSRYQKALAVCQQLHKVGIKGNMLSLNHPPAQQMLSVVPEKQKAIHDMWKYLSFIREDKTLLSLFAKMSLNMKEVSE